MALVNPWSWTAGDDATSARMQTLTDGITQLQGGTPTGSGSVLDFAMLRQTVTQTLTNGAFTLVSFDTEDQDVANGHSTVSNTSRYVVQNSGYVQVETGASFAANGTGLRAIRITKTGSVVPQGRVVVSPAPAANSTEIALTRTIQVTAGDYIEVQIRQDSGGSLNTVYSSPEVGCFLNVRWVHS